MHSLRHHWHLRCHVSGTYDKELERLIVTTVNIMKQGVLSICTNRLGKSTWEFV